MPMAKRHLMQEPCPSFFLLFYSVSHLVLFCGVLPSLWPCPHELGHRQPKTASFFLSSSSFPTFLSSFPPSLPPLCPRLLPCLPPVLVFLCLKMESHSPVQAGFGLKITPLQPYKGWDIETVSHTPSLYIPFLLCLRS